MIVACDFDGVIVAEPARPGESLVPVAGALEGLRALKRAGHVLLLCSGRANRSILENPELDPLVRAGKRRGESEAAREHHRERLREMLAFVEEHLPGVFDAIDDGRQGKPLADLYLDDRCLRVGPGAAGFTWREIANMYGEGG